VAEEYRNVNDEDWKEENEEQSGREHLHGNVLSGHRDVVVDTCVGDNVQHDDYCAYSCYGVSAFVADLPRLAAAVVLY